MAQYGTTEDTLHPGAYVSREVIPKGMSVTKAAELLGIGRPALSNFLNGNAALSQEMALRLERTFGADREALLDFQAKYDRRVEAIDTPVATGRHAPTRRSPGKNCPRYYDDSSAQRGTNSLASTSPPSTTPNGTDGTARSSRRSRRRGYRSAGPFGNSGAVTNPQPRQTTITAESASGYSLLKKGTKGPLFSSRRGTGQEREDGRQRKPH